MKYWALLFGLSMGIAFMPWLGTRWEAMLVPILDNQRVDRFTLGEDGDLCWYWTFKKVRTAQPLGFRYFITSTNLDETPVVFRRRDTPVTTTERPIGVASDQFCVRLPRGLAPGAKIRATGYAIYTVPHGLWVVRQQLPTVAYPSE